MVTLYSIHVSNYHLTKCLVLVIKSKSLLTEVWAKMAIVFYSKILGQINDTSAITRTIQIENVFVNINVSVLRHC